jgi:hypothetical protein
MFGPHRTGLDYNLSHIMAFTIALSRGVHSEVRDGYPRSELIHAMIYELIDMYQLSTQGVLSALHDVKNLALLRSQPRLKHE